MLEKRQRISRPIIPSYAVFPLLACVIVNFIVYMGADFVTVGWKHYNLTLPLDKEVPVIPDFAIIYLSCYLFWIVNYILIARQSEEHCLRFVTADMMSRLVCGMFYLILPTTNIRPELTGQGLGVSMLLFIYSIDAPTKLFPSIHCLVSWFCFIGIRGRKNIPKLYRIFSCVFALLVCASTQLTKQHYIVDVIGGILLAEGTYYLAFHTQIYRYPKFVFDRLYQKSFHGDTEPVGK